MKYPISGVSVGRLEEEYVLESLRSGWISSHGSFLGRFEAAFAEKCGVKHAVAVSNGTAALSLSLAALRIGAGDEVIVPALTFAAVPAAVVLSGARPVFVDVDPGYWCLDPELVRKAISAKTKAIIAVHSYGHPADLDPLLDAAGKAGVHVIEDCAEASGALYKGRRLGGQGVLGAYSFHGNKIITTGEGGMVVTNDDGLQDRVRFLRNHASVPERRFYHPEVGFNMKLTNIQAAIGLAQLASMEEFIAKRRDILSWYEGRLGTLGRLRLNPRMSWAEPVNWLLCAHFEGAKEEQQASFIQALRTHGIDSRPFFGYLPEMPPYSRYRMVSARRGVSNASILSASGVNLPCYTALTENDVDTICGVVRELSLSMGLCS